MAENIGASFSIDINNLKAGLNTANKLIRESQSEFKAAAAGMDDWRKSEDGLNAKIQSLTQVVSVQREKVSALKDAYQKELANGLDEASDRAVQLRTQINNEEAALRANEKELNENKKALDDLGNEAEDTGKDVEKSSKSWDKFGEAAKTAAKVAGAALAAVGAAAVAATKKIWDFANATAESADEIDKQSQKLGLSREAYQEWDYVLSQAGVDITSMSTGLKTLTNKLDDAKNGSSGAQEMFAKLGLSMDEINSMSREDVFKATIKGFQSMEDSTERAALANDLFGRSGQELTALFNETAESTDELIAKAHEYGMVISDEAVQAGVDFHDSLDTLTKTFDGVKNNLMSTLLPSFTTAMDGLSDLLAGVDGGAEKVKNGITGVLKNLSAMLPQVIEILSSIATALVESLPEVFSSISSEIINLIPEIVSAVLEILPLLLTAIIEMIPSLIGTLAQVVVMLINAIAEMLPTIVSAIMRIIPQLVTSIVAAIPQILQAAIKLLTAIVQAIPIIVTELVKALPEIIKTIVSTLLDNLPTLLDAAIELLMSIVDAIPEIVTALVDALPEIIDTLIQTLFNPETISKVIDGAIQLLMGIIQAIPQIITALVNALPQIINTIVTTLLDGDNLAMVIEGAVQLFMGLIKAIPQIIVELIKNLPQIIASIVKGLIEGIPQIFEVGKQLIQGLWEGISNAGKWLWEKISGFFGGIVDGIKSFFGISSPSKLMENVVGKNLALGIGEGFSDEMKNVNRDIVRSINDLENIDVEGLNSSLERSIAVNASGQSAARQVTVNQYNTYSQPHTRYEIYKSKQMTAAAVRLAMGAV